MKKRLLLFQVVVCASLVSHAQTTNPSANRLPGEQTKQTPATKPLPKAATTDWISAAQEKITRTAYYFKEMDGSFAVTNGKQQTFFVIDANSVSTQPLQPAGWSSKMELLQVSKGESSLAITNPAVKVKDNYLTYNYGGFTTEYIHDEKGLRQNFIITEKPAGPGKLQVSLSFSGDLVPVAKGTKSILLKDQSTHKTILQYDDLIVWDANRRPLPASMELDAGNELKLLVDDEQAVYPVTIDPLTHSAEWAPSAAGVLPGVLNNLSLQVDALYGYNVTGLGDVNGDGFDDVAIGAPGAIDIIAGPSTVVSAGAVFVYFGSDTGLSDLPGRTLRATTPVANALFGFSVAAGNVSGSTVAGSVRQDIIVGAPGESYNASVAGSPSTATVVAGKVYVFDGATLASGSSSALLSVFLNGSGLFSNGILGVLGVNTNINALFGFSVAVSGDMNGDGLGELVIGSPGYAGIQLLDVRSGAAFVYYSTNLAGNTATKLTGPTSTLLGLPLPANINGLLFGFSVDGAGDFDKDGRQDVVIGAPGGLNLGVLGFLGGSAFIYTGNNAGTGVNTAIKTRLSTTTDLLGSVANLFGYTVKGTRDGSGNRTGNVLVGAPVGEVLSDVLNELRLKTGNIYVFKGKTTPADTTQPAQSFSSPRGASLLSMLLSLNINVNALFGGAIDNMQDANCDGIGDIIVGEPLSTGVGLVGANVVGGAAYIFTGKADGTYNTTPYWTLENAVSTDFGINAASMVGYSVAGGGHVRGATKSVRAIVGAPGKSLDFGTGIFNLGNTFGTLFSFVGTDNGLGKAYAFGFGCDLLVLPDINITNVNVTIAGNVNTNDYVPAGTTYGTPVPLGGNPSGGTISMNPDGTYSFVATSAGTFSYEVPVCSPGAGCRMSILTITVVSTSGISIKPPIANTDIAITAFGMPVTIRSLANDASGTIGMPLNTASVTVITGPLHGTAVVNASTGNTVYTPAAGYQGWDTLYYQVCDFSSPTPLCATAMQVIAVQDIGAFNSTLASDDFLDTPPNVTATGNVKTNDADPEGNTQTVAARNVTVSGKGNLVLNADGSYVFTPVAGFTGPVSFVYTTCDNGSPQVCSNATLYILVTPVVNPDLTPSTRLSNGTFVESAGTSRDFVVEVNEILGMTTDNAAVPVLVRINKSDNFSYNFNPAATTASVPATIAVNNANWDLVTNTTTTLIFRLKAGNNIAPSGTSRILIRMQVMPGAAEGTENQTVVILNDSGTEINNTNNSVVRIFSIVQ